MVRSVLRSALIIGFALGVNYATAAHAQNNNCHLQGGSLVCEAKPSSGTPAVTGAAGTPLRTAQTAPKGTLKNPYAAQEASHDQKLAEEGQKIFAGYGCPGCHGGGGGGMCPPITNGIWIYGDSDDTLFRLVALGSQDLQAQGFTRQAIENIVAPMPSFGSIIKSDDDLWKIITWVKIQAYENTHK